jgi:DNA-binding transcriptional regulator YiaG
VKRYLYIFLNFNATNCNYKEVKRMNLETRDIYHIKRRKLGISLQTIADHFQVNKSTVSRWETGKTPMPKGYMKYIDNKENELIK